MRRLVAAFGVTLGTTAVEGKLSECRGEQTDIQACKETECEVEECRDCEWSEWVRGQSHIVCILYKQIMPSANTPSSSPNKFPKITNSGKFSRDFFEKKISAKIVQAELGGCTCEGLRERHRSILVQNNYCGQPCTGAKVETVACLPECHKPEKDCELSEWSEWTKCDKTCGGGQSDR
jgi:hypothetical protein